MPVPDYSPDILEPIARGDGREGFPAKYLEGMYGHDVWHAYELSWLGNTGRPESRVGRLVIPADSPCIPESKSLKLYNRKIELFDNLHKIDINQFIK